MTKKVIQRYGYILACPIINLTTVYIDNLLIKIVNINVKGNQKMKYK